MRQTYRDGKKLYRIISAGIVYIIKGTWTALRAITRLIAHSTKATFRWMRRTTPVYITALRHRTTKLRARFDGFCQQAAHTTTTKVLPALRRGFWLTLLFLIDCTLFIARCARKTYLGTRNHLMMHIATHKRTKQEHQKQAAQLLIVAAHCTTRARF